MTTYSPVYYAWPYGVSVAIINSWLRRRAQARGRRSMAFVPMSYLLCRGCNEFDID